MRQGLDKYSYRNGTVIKHKKTISEYRNSDFHISGFAISSRKNIQNQEASKKDIKFVSDFRYPIRDEVDVYDIGIILNNALDNAIEACEKISNNRKIWLKSYEKGNLYFIEIENTFDEIIMDPETGLPESDKADKELHGFGISNIEKSAKKYMGDIDIDIKNEDEKIFCLTVMLGKVCE